MCSGLSLTTLLLTNVFIETIRFFGLRSPNLCVQTAIWDLTNFCAGVCNLNCHCQVAVSLHLSYLLFMWLCSSICKVMCVLSNPMY